MIWILAIVLGVIFYFIGKRSVPNYKKDYEKYLKSFPKPKDDPRD